MNSEKEKLEAQRKMNSFAKFIKENDIHPVECAIMSAWIVGWNVAIKGGEINPVGLDDDDPIVGIVMGNKEYINEIFPPEEGEGEK